MASRNGKEIKMGIGLALFQPEIAANLGAAIRIAACFGAELHVIEPCGFPWKSKDIDRVAMDYGTWAQPRRHASWAAYRAAYPGRLIVLTTQGSVPHHQVAYQDGDHLLIGQESAGVPAHIHDSADARVRIPLAPGVRSLNMAVAGAVALAEAQRQFAIAAPATPSQV